MSARLAGLFSADKWIESLLVATATYRTNHTHCVFAAFWTNKPADFPLLFVKRKCHLPKTPGMFQESVKKNVTFSHAWWEFQMVVNYLLWENRVFEDPQPVWLLSCHSRAGWKHICIVIFSLGAAVYTTLTTGLTVLGKINSVHSEPQAPLCKCRTPVQ